jgi:hypothetical protein
MYVQDNLPDYSKSKSGYLQLQIRPRSTLDRGLDQQFLDPVPDQALDPLYGLAVDPTQHPYLLTKEFSKKSRNYLKSQT